MRAFQEDTTHQLLRALKSASVGLQNGTKDRNGPLVPAFFSERPDTIAIADKPLSQGGTLQEIPIIEFEQQTGVTWSESPLVHEVRKTKIYDDPNCQMQHLNLIFEQLFFQKPKMVICDIDDQVGQGVFARQTFAKFSLISIYTGLIESSFEGNPQHKAYGFNCKDRVHLKTMFAKHYGTPMIDAQKIRNYSSYFQHAPDNDTLKTLDIPEEIKQQIISANVAIFPASHLAFPVLLIIALRDIEAGEQLVFDYGNYWQDQQRMQQGDGIYCLFDQHANIVGHIKGQHFTQNPDHHPSNPSKAPRAHCNGYDSQMMIALQERKLTANIDRYLKAHLKAVLTQLPESLKYQHQPLFRVFHRLIDTKNGPELYNGFVREMAEANMEPILELTLTTRTLYSALNRYFADYQALQNKDKPYLQGHFARKDELLAFLEAKTGKSWKYSRKQSCFYLSGDKASMQSVKEWFDQIGIRAKQFGQSKDGITFLSYLARDITLQTLASLQTHYEPPMNLLKL